jgi:hypothetical protein
LNDTIIDWMTDVLASKTDTKSKPCVAVFDSHFQMISEEPGGNNPRYNHKFYQYDRLRTYAHRKLRGWSPLTIDCMLFPNNYGGWHWDLILIFPKQRAVTRTLGLYSGGSSTKQVMIIRGMSINCSCPIPRTWVGPSELTPHFRDRATVLIAAVSPWLCGLRVVRDEPMSYYSNVGSRVSHQAL